jgi:hypothetical protein
MSRVLLVLSLTLITMDRAQCLYALLTEAAIDYGSVVTVTMMFVQHENSCTVLPYGALVTQIIQYAKVNTDGMIELALKKGPITTHHLNASNAHLQDAVPALRPQRRRMTRADGASTSASQVERLSRIEAMLHMYG